MLILSIILFVAIIIFSSKYPWWLPAKKGLIVLMYHHIYKYDDTCDLEKTLYVEPDVFARQMDFLLKHKWTPVTFEDLQNSYKNNSFKLPKKPVLITFDDGWLDNYTKAFPILKEKNIKANIFISYDYIGRPGCMNWSHILEMKNSGLVCFGSHTLSHAKLTSLTDREISNELTESKRLLEEKLQLPVNCFAYPYGAGAFDEKIREIVFKSGYLFDFSTKRGITSFKWNKQKAINRLYIKQGLSLFDFYLLLTKGKNSF